MSFFKVNMDDGMNSELVVGATFDGVFEMPLIRKPKTIIRPDGFTPFTQRHRAPSNCEVLSFFEFDTKFSDILVHPKAYLDVARDFIAFVPPDCSVYRDMPLAAQVANIYRCRAIGFYFQRMGVNVYPLVRWGDERTYTNEVLSEPVAFSGIEQNSAVVISTYGCIQGRENKEHFKAGLEAMIEHISPEVVFVHGAMPESVFSDVKNKTKFLQYPDWITRMKGRS